MGEQVAWVVAWRDHRDNLTEHSVWVKESSAREVFDSLRESRFRPALIKRIITEIDITPPTETEAPINAE